jgi:hypothetical protein
MYFNKMDREILLSAILCNLSMADTSSATEFSLVIVFALQFRFSFGLVPHSSPHSSRDGCCHYSNQVLALFSQLSLTRYPTPVFVFPAEATICLVVHARWARAKTVSYPRRPIHFGS